MMVETCLACGRELLFDPVTDTLVCPVCEPSPSERLEAEKLEEEREILEEAF